MLYLLRKLYILKLNEFDDMVIHITSTLEVFDKLSALGENVRDTHISAFLLCSLLVSYDVLFTTHDSRNEEELTWVLIKIKLLDESELKHNQN